MDEISFIVFIFWFDSLRFAILMIIGSREIDVYPFNENSLFTSVGVMYIRRFKVNSIVRCQHFCLNIQVDPTFAIIVDSDVRLHVDFFFFFSYLVICQLLWRLCLLHSSEKDLRKQSGKNGCMNDRA